jgi:peptidyl-prolyl cis-trans isomerase C
MRSSNRRVAIATAALAAGALSIAGCGPGAGGPGEQSAITTTTLGSGEVVATYKGRKLTSDAVVKEIERLPTPSRSYLNAPDRKRQFVDNMIMNDLLYEEGKQAGFDQDADIDRQVNDLRKRLVIQKVMRQYQTPPTITDEQVRAYYDQNPSLYSTTQIRASHILVKDEDTAKQALAEVRAHPEKFADVAKEKSTDVTSAQRGGELGMFGQGRMVPDFERVAFALKPGEISDIVKTQYGYHIITVTERKEGEAKPFDQVKEQIRAMLRNKGLQDQVQGHFDTLKKSADVKIDDDALARITPPAMPAAPPGAGGGGHPAPPGSGH